jgi:hypothetical protein
VNVAGAVYMIPFGAQQTVFTDSTQTSAAAPAAVSESKEEKKMAFVMLNGKPVTEQVCALFFLLLLLLFVCFVLVSCLLVCFALFFFFSTDCVHGLDPDVRCGPSPPRPLALNRAVCFKTARERETG